MNTIQLQSAITCPNCGTQKLETMPTNACQFFYECEFCHHLLKPKAGDCCVYCSYAMYYVRRFSWPVAILAVQILELPGANVFEVFSYIYPLHFISLSIFKSNVKQIVLLILCTRLYLYRSDELEKKHDRFFLPIFVPYSLIILTGVLAIQLAGPIAFLNWPVITINFKVKDRALMQEIKVENVVTFTFIH